MVLVGAGPRNIDKGGGPNEQVDETDSRPPHPSLPPHPSPPNPDPRTLAGRRGVDIIVVARCRKISLRHPPPPSRPSRRRCRRRRHLRSCLPLAITFVDCAPWERPIGKSSSRAGQEEERGKYVELWKILRGARFLYLSMLSLSIML